MRILAGDIGGTKTLLALFDIREGAAIEIRSERFASTELRGLEEAVDRFMAGEARPDRAGFGVAGLVHEGRARITNLPWVIDAAALATQLDLASVAVVNDFTAVALGVSSLPPAAREVLQSGEVDSRGPVVILGAGTGLGQAVLVPTPSGPRVLASEGGHADFAPRSALEMDLLRYLLERYERVSVERVVSGPGLADLYEWTIARGDAPACVAIQSRLAEEDPGAVIGQAAIDQADAGCVLAVDRFLSLYGAEAGNLALKVIPRGGLFVAGGIAPRLRPLFARPDFLEGFLGKGRMRPLLAAIRVELVLDPRVGLYGARAAAVLDAPP